MRTSVASPYLEPWRGWMITHFNFIVHAYHCGYPQGDPKQGACGHEQSCFRHCLQRDARIGPNQVAGYSGLSLELKPNHIWFHRSRTCKLVSIIVFDQHQSLKYDKALCNSHLVWKFLAHEFWTCDDVGEQELHTLHYKSGKVQSGICGLSNKDTDANALKHATIAGYDSNPVWVSRSMMPCFERFDSLAKWHDFLSHWQQQPR